MLDITTPSRIPTGTRVGPSNPTSTTVTISNNAVTTIPIGDTIEFQNNYQDDFPLDGSGNPTDPTQPATFGDQFSRLDRVTSEIKEIDHVTGSTIFFTSPISISYRTANTAQLSWFSDAGDGTHAVVPHLQGAGVESLAMANGDNGGISFNWAAYSWAKDVEVGNWCGFGVSIFSSYRIEYRNFTITMPLGSKPAAAPIP